MAEVTYLVRVKGPFSAPSRRRAGIVVDATDGYEGPLTSDQLKAIRADSSLSVVKAGDVKTSGDDEIASAKAEAKKIVEAAKAEAAEIVGKAEEEAAATTQKAEEEAKAIKAKASEAKAPTTPQSGNK